uniref:Uncharacterized protein n=1 Tax=Knipowitschia caucasica TaxID=637954 RepID=A0AAV2MJ73_KNICA
MQLKVRGGAPPLTHLYLWVHAENNTSTDEGSSRHHTRSAPRQSWHFLDPPIENKWRKNQEAFGGFEEGKNSRFTRTLPNVTATHQWNLRVRRCLTYKQNRAMRVCPIVQRRAK